MKITLLLIFTLTLSFACTRKTTESKTQANKTEQQVFKPTYPCKTNCEAFDENLCKRLFREYDKCENSKTREACGDFIVAFGLALPKKVKCTNSCSPEPFPSATTSLCDNIDPSGFPKITERAARLLGSLKFKEAQKLYESKLFKDILDGAMAEDHNPNHPANHEH